MSDRTTDYDMHQYANVPATYVLIQFLCRFAVIDARRLNPTPTKKKTMKTLFLKCVSNISEIISFGSSRRHLLCVSHSVTILVSSEKRKKSTAGHVNFG